jgi:hypothetical protein
MLHRANLKRISANLWRTAITSEYPIIDLSPREEFELLENHYNRVTDNCIPEEEASAGSKAYP